MRSVKQKIQDKPAAAIDECKEIIVVERPEHELISTVAKGWNDSVRLYRPQKEIVDGTSKFLESLPVT